MGKIHELPLSVVAHIAAGEVVERPAYAVKELIENALDAGATAIRVEIQNGGLDSIVVTDNGEGMDTEDIQRCFKPHTTSKILDEHDLAAVRTYGFRGEALATIAAVSVLEIASRTKDVVTGTEVVVKAGTVDSVQPIGMPVGTRIRVQDLFFSVPARKKFLQSARREFGTILDCVVRQALSHHACSFLLAHNGNVFFDLPASSRQERIQALLGAGLIKQFLPVNHEDSYLKITGYIAVPERSTSTTAKQFLFVNNRPIEDKRIAQLIKNTYGPRLEKTKLPLFLLFITCGPEFVDVNVHPRKQEVAFGNRELLYSSITQAVHAALTSGTPALMFSTPYQASTATTTGQLLKQHVIPWDMRETRTPERLFQLNNVYIVLIHKAGISLIDQHAAHERILFEQFAEAFRTERNFYTSQPLSQPLFFDVSVAERALLSGHMSIFERLGFEIDHFKDNTFVIRAVPPIFTDRDHRALIEELLEHIAVGEHPKTDEFTDRVLKYLACRAAVKAGDPLTEEECESLIEKLASTPHNQTCPHGRPTKIEIFLSELHIAFKRTA